MVNVSLMVVDEALPVVGVMPATAARDHEKFVPVVALTAVYCAVLPLQIPGITVVGLLKRGVGFTITVTF